MHPYFNFHHFLRGHDPMMAGGDEGRRGGHHGGGHHGRFGRGGPFGRHRGGPFGGRGPRMFDSGALRLVVLGLIAAEPRHGYDIIKALETRFQGAYSPSPGAIYPMLQMLEEADLVSSTTTGNKRLYTITEAGQAYVEEHRSELNTINAQLDQASGDIRESQIGEEIKALRMTLFQKVRGGELSAEQAARLRTILQATRQQIEEL